MTKDRPATRTGTSPARVDAPLVRLAAVLLVGAVATMLDSTIVAVAIDGLARVFGSPVSAVQWVGTAYLLAMASVIPLSGWALDRFGARRAWIAAMLLFGAGSALSATAWSLASLVAFRVVTGLGAGLVLPLVIAILARAAGPGRLGRAMAMVTVPGQLAPVLGPLAGGLLLDGPGWRWLFLVHPPIAVLAVLAAVAVLPDDPAGGGDGDGSGDADGDAVAGERRLDLVGLALLSPALAALLYGLSTLGSGGGPTAAALTGAGLVLGGAFVWHALRRRPSGSPAPVLDLRLFREFRFTLGAALMFVFGAGIWAPMFVVPLFYQQARGASALEAGLLLAPQGLGMAVAVLCVGGLADRAAPRLLVVGGMALAAAATVPFAFATAHTPDLVLGAALFGRGVGLGAAGIPVMAVAYRGLAPDRIPRATSALTVLQRIGAAAGTAGLALVLTRVAAAAAGSGAPVPVAAFQSAFWWMIGLTAVALVPALLLPSTPPTDDLEGRP
ncbi:DHA2 family efflux MFS transporter permease subunit [Nocardiopsis aegyptia]|uniref:DHA2 family efflux MFS transporter permease subunit n=1 Tax=Nocardiopsis aegyptia TaxID=220378 RepID=UPI00366B9F3E